MLEEKKKINKIIFDKNNNELKNKEKEIKGVTKQNVTGTGTSINEKYPLLLVSISGIPYTPEQFKRLKSSNNRNNTVTKAKGISNEDYAKQYNAWLKESSKDYF